MITSWLLKLVPWYARWIMLGVLILAAAAFGAAQMHSHDEKRYEELVADFSAFKARTAQAAEDAELRTKSINAAQLAATAEMEARYVQIQSARDHSSAALVAELRGTVAKLTIGGGRQLPGIPDTAGPADDTVCFDREQLTAGIQGSLQRFAGRFADLVKRGAEGIDLAALARDWIAGARSVERLNPAQ